MTSSLFSMSADEPSRQLGFAGNRLDRLSENRAEDALETALAAPDARLLVSRGGRVVLKVNGEGFEPWFGVAESAAAGARLEHAVLLGWDRGTPVLAAPGGIEPDDLPDGLKAIDHRSVYVQGLLDEPTLGALAQGASLLAWNASHRFCGRCGAKTVMRIGGYKRVCTGCEAQLFPRTDPVAIMLAVREEKCLLGRSPHFPPGMYSCLAGFIEPGETIEDAVRRETFEESGIRIGRVAYHASQPWPFPHSLMIGCFGEALTEEIDADREELEDCRWFSRQEVIGIIAGTHPDGILMPPPGAIASHLVRAWAQQR
ncbi:NAD(+) diphosphatase [Chelativorans sp. ZYF759]|uniref:NAD(+) diphosphatase n=1 Tax=Chelativorans sp. ZYF759 TaxID=2692213 RepID=UPI00145E479C|nr:NAD(+) diphosphatase [Chelativorans sp. ZYF759]NMG40494.1 NAD(+) diphosphatase [Chelativorans sp. ZYF759]